MSSYINYFISSKDILNYILDSCWSPLLCVPQLQDSLESCVQTIQCLQQKRFNFHYWETTKCNNNSIFGKGLLDFTDNQLEKGFVI